MKGEWYAYGSIVIERVLGVERCRDVSIYFRGAKPSHSEVLSRLGLGEDTVFSFSPELGPAVCNFDLWSLWPDNTLKVRPEGYTDDPVVASPPNQLKLLQYDLTAADLFRLADVMRSYPELRVAPPLRARLLADTRYFQSVVREFPELQQHFFLHPALSA